MSIKDVYDFNDFKTNYLSFYNDPKKTLNFVNINTLIDFVNNKHNVTQTKEMFKFIIKELVEILFYHNEELDLEYYLNPLLKFNKYTGSDYGQYKCVNLFPLIKTIILTNDIEFITIIEKLTNYNTKKVRTNIVNNYILNINDRLIMSDQVSIKLTEKELNILLFLNSKRNQPQNVEILQSKIWGYGENLETHTVETHIYRLRKKISNKFSDYSFIKSNKYGYFL